MLPGVCLGINERTEESLIGTSRGVIKCRTVARMAEDRRWNADIILGMKGVPWEFVPGRIHFQIPTNTDDDGNAGEDADTDVKEPMPLDEETAGTPALKGGQDSLHWEL